MPAFAAVDVDGRDELSGPERRVREALPALEDLPAVVRERPNPGAGPVVDLLPRVLTDVRDVEIAVCSVEGEPPGISQAEGNDLPANRTLERVRAQQLPQPLVHALGSVAGIAAGPAVAHADVQKAVAVELELPPVVIRVGLPDEQELAGGRLHAASAAGAELDDPRVPAAVGVVHVEAVVARIRGMERDREQPLLSAADDPVADVEERPSKPAVDEVANAPDLLDRVEAPGLGRRRGDRRQRREAPGERTDGELLLALCRWSGECDGGGENGRDHPDPKY